MKVRVGVFVALLLAPALVGCGGSAPGPRDATAASRTAANQRLQGAWVLEGFRPEVPLEPMLQGLLAAQLGHLRVTFDGKQVVALGPGVSATRRYVVTDAVFDRVKVTVYDEGIPYQVEGEFKGNQIQFHALTSPWRGTGVLVRSQER